MTASSKRSQHRALSGDRAPAAGTGSWCTDRFGLRARFGRSRPLRKEPSRWSIPLGLVPGTDQSGSSDPQQRISKQGDEMLRRLMVGSAHYILGPFASDSDLRRHGEKIASRGGKKNAKKRAAVAVARKLSALLYHLWMTGEIYEPLYNAHRCGDLAA